VDDVVLAALFEEVVEGDGVGFGGERGSLLLGEGDDAVPALGDDYDALEAAAAAVAEGAGHDAVGGDHEVFDEIHGAVLGGVFEADDAAVDDDGVGFGLVELERAGGDAGGVEELGGLVLELELGG
jgi:hypothetical protein